MSEPLSRRTVLRAVAGTAVVAPVVVAEASPHPTAFPLTHDCDLELLELRRAIEAYQAAVRYEMSIEGEPGHDDAVAESDARQAVVQALVDGIHERTPVSLRDVFLRAAVLRTYYFDGPRELVEDSCCAPDLFALGKLYEAVEQVGGGHV